MENFKLENFKKEYGLDMPIEKHLSLYDCNVILSCIYDKFHVYDVNDLFSKLENESIYVTSVENETINVEDVFFNLGIIVSSNVFINWYKFDNIDSLSFRNLCRYFDDIWYPAIDDIEIFDETCNWILSIRHYGIVSYLKSEESNNRK